MGVIDPAAYSTIVAKAAQVAWEKRCETITVHAPADDPFVRHCRRYGAKIEVTYPCCSGGMARVIDQSALFAQLEPLLGTRLQGALPGWEGTLFVATELGSNRLRFGHGARQVAVEMPQGRWPSSCWASAAPPRRPPRGYAHRRGRPARAGRPVPRGVPASTGRIASSPPSPNDTRAARRSLRAALCVDRSVAVG